MLWWCSEPIEEGAFACRYIGEVVTVADAEARLDASYQLELQVRDGGGREQLQATPPQVSLEIPTACFQLPN